MGDEEDTPLSKTNSGTGRSGQSGGWPSVVEFAVVRGSGCDGIVGGEGGGGRAEGMDGRASVATGKCWTRRPYRFPAEIRTHLPREELVLEIKVWISDCRIRLRNRAAFYVTIHRSSLEIASIYRLLRFQCATENGNTGMIYIYI
ncbi:hypothetical protein HPP92_027101 [Vanilla planifolia]|uniref:Uncharacterized protein n=1 Tax=Vanilla planifolia TaxID=51239 RepID=A0A835PCT6_VANPL|nr:hypothetical protein HPP92_027101 [Vanilla planifolia]